MTECRGACVDDGVRVDVGSLGRELGSQALVEDGVGDDQEDGGADELGEHEQGHGNGDLGGLEHGLDGDQRLRDKRGKSQSWAVPSVGGIDEDGRGLYIPSAYQLHGRER